MSSPDSPQMRPRLSRMTSTDTRWRLFRDGEAAILDFNEWLSELPHIVSLTRNEDGISKASI